MDNERTEGLFQAGAYYVGDMCYVLTEAQWNALPTPPEYGQRYSWRMALNGQFVWIGYTAYGDGLYNDQEGFAYSVDSGSLCVIPVSVCDPGRLYRATVARPLARVVTFPAPFTPTNDAGRFVIGHVVIDTRGQGEEETA